MEKNKRAEKNPLSGKWNSPFGSPPFDKIKPSHFRPAIEKAIKEAEKEIEAITYNSHPPTFSNTAEAMERSGDRLGKISAVLFNLNSAETDDELQAAAQDASPLLTRFSNDVTLNAKLFERIKAVYDKRGSAALSAEQKELIGRRYRSFILGGSGLSNEMKQRFREISEELSTLSLKFEENLLHETNSFELHIKDESDLAGLPSSLVALALQEASGRDKPGWIFTLHYPSYVPFMQYSAKRELREKMFRAYSSRAFTGNKYDNRYNVLRIANLRLEIATILGFGSYAEMILGDRMAQNSDKVTRFLNELHEASHPAALRDFENLRSFAGSCGHTGNIERWDWAYYSEKLKKELHQIDDEILKPYFSLENAEAAIFKLAGLLYGIRFVRNNDTPVYNAEVATWEVYDSDNTFVSLLFIDYHPRKSKSGGAWMTSYREQSISSGGDIRPVISIVANFTRATPGRPSLLSFNELSTFLHEFGHALHGMLSKCTYESLSGTNVARDFVELPSQFMENYAYEKEWLNTWARHYVTGETIPDALITKIKDASTFNEGYACLRQLGFAFLDMAWHNITDPVNSEISLFESVAMAKSELFPSVDGTSTSASFAHIFGGGYAAGYYGYKWAEVLDADAFSWFAANGIFNSKVASSFRKNILEKGGTEKPMDLYRKFRGQEPTIEAFLVRSGLK